MNAIAPAVAAQKIREALTSVTRGYEQRELRELGERLMNHMRDLNLIDESVEDQFDALLNVEEWAEPDESTGRTKRRKDSQEVVRVWVASQIKNGRSLSVNELRRLYSRVFDVPRGKAASHVKTALKQLIRDGQVSVEGQPRDLRAGNGMPMHNWQPKLTATIAWSGAKGQSQVFLGQRSSGQAPMTSTWASSLSAASGKANGGSNHRTSGFPRESDTGPQNGLNNASAGN